MRSLVFLALLISAGVVLGEGKYQRAQDDKTMVWNDAPKQGDTASWNGDRDNEGYAKGFGTLTWYTTDTGLFATYYGNMVRGKLEGPVNVHARGKTAYAIFVNGKRETRWKNGRAPSRQVLGKQLAAARKKAAKTEKTEDENPPKDGSAVADAQRSELTAASPSTGGPDGHQPMEGAVAESSSAAKSEPAPETVAKVEKDNPPAVAGTSPSAATPVGRITSNIQVPAARTEVPRGEGTTGQPPVTPPPAKAESTPQNVAKVEKDYPPSVPAPTSVAISDQPVSTPNELPREEYSLEDGLGNIAENPFASEPSSTAAIAEPQKDSRTEIAPPKPEGGSGDQSGGLVGFQDPKDKKHVGDKPAPQSSAPASTDASISVEEKKPDNSVQVVMQPPSSLRRALEHGTEPGDQAQLTKDEVIGAADTAARAAGYNLKDYGRPKPEYNSSSGTWSLVYDHKPVGGNAESGEPFSVAVDDKTKRASIVAGL